MKTNYRKLTSALLALGFVALFASEGLAQNFQNDGTYNATCGGVIRMRANTGEITGTTATGLSDAKAIPGVVDWASSSATQTVQAYYYERLVLSGGAKNVLTGVFVTGDACPSFLVGYDNLVTYPFYSTVPAGDLTFNGTFNYTGGTQTIYPTDATDPYVTLNVTSTATFPVGDVYADNVTATGTVSVLGDLNLSGPLVSTFDNTVTLTDGSILTGTGAVGFAGAVTVDATSDITVSGTGAVTFGSTLALNGDLVANDGGVGGLGTVNLDGATTIGATGSMDFGGSTNLVVSSSLANSGDGTNLLFNCSSTVTYDGGIQTIMPTIPANPYGNLVLTTAGLKTGGTAGYSSDIAICKNFSLNGGNLDMYKGGTNSGTLVMTDATLNPSYTGLFEVVGSMQRTTVASAFAYTFNNAGTSITLLADGVGNENPTDMTMFVLPGTAPNGYAAATDVNRKVTLDYTAATPANPFEMEVQVAYLNSEAQGWGSYTESQLRFYEADGTGVEKVGTGEVYGKTASVGGGTPSFGTLSLAGIGNTTTTAVPNGIGLFASGNDLLMRSGPTTFYSIADGRWTNPETWDEGTIPTAIDNAEIRTMVYAGIDGPFAGTVALGNTTSESDHYAGAAAANSIEVADYAGASFILGNEDNEAAYVFKTAATGDSFINNNPRAMTPTFVAGLAPLKSAYDAGGNPGFNGVWITKYITAAKSVILRSDKVINKGEFNNEGVVEIGN